MRLILLLCSASFLLLRIQVSAQTIDTTGIHAADDYLDRRTRSFEKYLHKSQKLQQRLLHRLRHKEQKTLRKLAAKDSALYYQYLAAGSFDSISRLQNDSACLAKIKNTPNTLVDSLKGICRFLQQKQQQLQQVAGQAGNLGIDLPYTDQLSQLQQQAGVLQHTSQLLQKKWNNLLQLNQAQSLNLSGLTQLQKHYYYAGEKIKALKQIADDPDEAEEKAWEYLQGIEGFDSFIRPESNAWGGLGNNASAADLERLGFQTKSSVNKALQQKLGDQLANVQQQMAEDISQYSEPLKALQQKANEVKSSAQALREQAKALQEQGQQVRDALHPGFSPNPERGKPFWQRIEKQYHFRTLRASVEGERPAMLELGGSLGFKHTPRLSYGLGLNAQLGLGSNWQHLRFSYEGLTGSAYADLKLWLGISGQAGYEYSLRPRNRPYLTENQQQSPVATGTEDIFRQAFGGRQQAAYIGFMKRYRINSQWNGTLLIAYDLLWQQQGLRTPIMLRMGWAK